jgi:adenine-specific DNA-methyltransferase
MRDKDDIFDNVIIRGDNLLALKALEPAFVGQVKCICIDPPYNTGSALEHYEDGVEHSLWLSLMRDRLELLRRLLSENGSIWITIDDNEMYRLKLLLDEVFDARNFVGTIVWQKRTSPANDAQYFSRDHDYLLVYAKSIGAWTPNRLQLSGEQEGNYRNPDGDPRGPWNSAAYTCAKTAEERPNLYYAIENPNTGEKVWPKTTRVWAYGPETHARNEEQGLVYWGLDGRARMPRIRKFLSASKPVVPRSIWLNAEVGNNQEARNESLRLFGDKPFSSPKPERLIKRILEIGSNPNDLILDSFGGSGTTAAVAHKMRRRWITVEVGEHCDTHILPRLHKVVDGSDGGGITAAVGWKGGGGFRYYHLAPSLIETDRWGNRVISKNYNAPMLAEAMCKHLGFIYEPAADPREYWKHGYSTERDFIYVTTASLTTPALRRISEDVGPDRTLLVCCKAFDSKADAFGNLTLKKIPQAVLANCEWGRDDYSLRISQLPMRDDEPELTEGSGKPKKRNKASDHSPSLFDSRDS